jgi:hypothetical protein
MGRTKQSPPYETDEAVVFNVRRNKTNDNVGALDTANQCIIDFDNASSSRSITIPIHLTNNVYGSPASMSSRRNHGQFGRGHKDLYFKSDIFPPGLRT